MGLKGAITYCIQILKEQEALDRTPDDDEHYDMRNGMDDIISGLSQDIQETGDD